jgi:hypothetical protein
LPVPSMVPSPQHVACFSSTSVSNSSLSGLGAGAIGGTVGGHVASPPSLSPGYPYASSLPPPPPSYLYGGSREQCQTGTGSSIASLRLKAKQHSVSPPSTPTPFSVYSGSSVSGSMTSSRQQQSSLAACQYAGVGNGMP